MLRKTLGIATGIALLAAGMVMELIASGRVRLESGSRDSAPTREGADAPAQGQLTDGALSLREDASRAAGIRTEVATRGVVPEWIESTGEVRLAEDRVAHVTPRISGAICALSKGEGDPVKAGETLCYIESVEVGEAEAALVSALSEETVAERNLESLKGLAESGFRPQSEIWSAEKDVSHARVEAETALNKLRVLGIPPEEIEQVRRRGAGAIADRYALKSPIAGHVFARHATLGETVEPKDEVFVIGDLSEVWVRAALYDRDFLSVHVGMRAVVRVQACPGESFEGEVTHLGREVDPATRTTPVRIVVKNRCIDGCALHPGMVATVSIERQTREGVVVPAEAVQALAGKDVVFVAARRADGQVGYAQRIVTLGPRDERSVQVADGLHAGEEVVTTGSFLLKSEVEKDSFAGGD